MILALIGFEVGAEGFAPYNCWLPLFLNCLFEAPGEVHPTCNNEAVYK